MTSGARRRRLLCVYQHAPTPGAPGIYRHRSLFAELVRRGWHVDLVSTPVNYMTGTVPPRYARRPYVREEIDGITHHWVAASGRIHASRVRRALNYVTFAASSFLRAATLPRPDVVLASSPPLPVGLVGELLALRFRRPWVLEVRDIWPESAVSVGWLEPTSPLYRLLDRLARHLVARCDATMVPTPGLVDGVLGHGAPAVDVVTGAVLDAAPAPEVRTRVREELGVADATTLFAYVGAVGAANGLDLLLDAVALLPPEAAAHVIVAGDGSDRERLERRLAAERLDRITMLGVVPKGRVPELLAAADVCLHLLRPDPVFESALPTKVLEYLGAHRPFVTTVPGLPERLASDSGGSFASDAEELARVLADWTALPPATRVERGERAFAYGSSRFGLAAAADRLEEVLERVRR